MKLSLGFSPCPNDTFIFDAMVNNKIDTRGLAFEVVLEDVQTLNQWALQEHLDISKISYGVLPLILKEYLLLDSGGALGKGVGPLLICRNEPLTAHATSTLHEQIEAARQLIAKSTVAIPGKNTTAHLLFSLAFPQVQQKLFKVFNEIEDAVLNAECDAGVIIHENRFTYQQRGLYKIADLGEFWEMETGVPIPLGGIVAKRSLDKNIAYTVQQLIKESVAFAYRYHYEQLSDYVKMHAQEMAEKVMRQHIDLYVNNFSSSLGEEGQNAVLRLVDIYQQQCQKPAIQKEHIFLF